MSWSQDGERFSGMHGEGGAADVVTKGDHQRIDISFSSAEGLKPVTLRRAVAVNLLRALQQWQEGLRDYVPCSLSDVLRAELDGVSSWAEHPGELHNSGVLIRYRVFEGAMQYHDTDTDKWRTIEIDGKTLRTVADGWRIVTLAKRGGALQHVNLLYQDEKKKREELEERVAAFERYLNSYGNVGSWVLCQTIVRSFRSRVLGLED